MQFKLGEQKTSKLITNYRFRRDLSEFIILNFLYIAYTKSATKKLHQIKI